MQCQFESLRDRNVIVKCFNEACYHVASAKPDIQNYCPIHIQRLPRKTKLELLLDVIELPPSEILRHNSDCTQTETEKIEQSSAGSVTSISDLMCGSFNEQNPQGEAGPLRTFTFTATVKKEFARPFRNLGELCECYGYLPRPKTWRMLPFGVPGEINGLHNTRGMALATNGIHVAIENSECKELFIGHLEWFIIDDLNAPAGSLQTLQNTAKDTIAVVRNQLKQFDDLFV